MTEQTAPDAAPNADGCSLARLRIESDWRLADWLAEQKRAGAMTTGRLAQLSQRFGIARTRLRDATNAATRFPPTLRLSSLSFEHHAAIVSLADDVALPLLRRAEAEGLPVSAMREAVTQQRYATGERWDDEDVDSTLCTLTLRAWNRATPQAREMAFELMEIAAANGFAIVDEDEVANG